MNKTIRLYVFVIVLLSTTALFGQAKHGVDVIVSGGTVVTMNPTRAIIEDGAVAISGDTIVAVGPRAEITSAYAGRQTIEAAGKLIVPGWVNGHTHVPMTLFRG